MTTYKDLVRELVGTNLRAVQKINELNVKFQAAMYDLLIEQREESNIEIANFASISAELTMISSEINNNTVEILLTAMDLDNNIPE